MRLLLATLWQQFRRWPRLIAGYVVTTVLMLATWIADPLLGGRVIDSVSLLVRDAFDQDTFLALFLLWVAVSASMSVIQAIHKLICWRMLNCTYVSFFEESYEHVLAMDVAQHIQRRAGSIIKKIDNGADTLWDLGFQMFQVMVPSIAAALVFLGVAFAVNVRMTLVVVGMLILYGAAMALFTRRAYPLQSTISRIYVGIIGRAYDTVTNILTTKSAPGEEREVRRMRYWHRRTMRLQKRADVLWAMLEGLNMFVLLRALIVGLGIFLISRNELTLGELFFFLFIVFRLVAPIEVVGSFLPKWNEKIEKVRMALSIRQLRSIVQNPKNPKRIPNPAGEIRFERVSFSYAKASAYAGTEAEKDEEEEINILDPRLSFEEEQGERERHMHKDPIPFPEPPREIPHAAEEQRRDAISDLSLAIAPGEHIALVGHSGSGKSTLAALLNRFFDVTGGAILIDGIDVRDLDLQWYRRQIGLVLQESTMFNDSVIANIRYTKPGANDAEVMDAARRASAHDFILQMQDKYETNIGERGVRLSGGERQRIAIARAILKNPLIVVLDEATSALDSVTERKVQEGIAALIAGRTAIIIAHRLSTVRRVDRIAVLAKGKLLVCAPHEELMAICPVYREMVELQSRGMLAE